MNFYNYYLHQRDSIFDHHFNLKMPFRSMQRVSSVASFVKSLFHTRTLGVFYVLQDTVSYTYLVHKFLEISLHAVYVVIIFVANTVHRVCVALSEK